MRRSRDETGLGTLTPNPHLPTQPHGPFFSASQQPLSCSYFSLGNLWRQSKFPAPTPCLGPQTDNTGSVLFLKSSSFHPLNFTAHQLRTWHRPTRHKVSGSKQIPEELSTLEINFSEGFESELHKPPSLSGKCLESQVIDAGSALSKVHIAFATHKLMLERQINI